MDSPPGSPSKALPPVPNTPPPSSPRECPGAPKIGEGNFPMNDSERHEKYLDEELKKLIQQPNYINTEKYNEIINGYSELFLGDDDIHNKVAEKLTQFN